MEDDVDEAIVVRNSMYRQPPAIHNHHMRNSFLRNYDKHALISLEKEIKKEIFDELT